MAVIVAQTSSPTTVPPPSLPSLADIRRAADRIQPHLLRTPLERARFLPGDIYLKLECFQPTGSFKLRGALAKLTVLPKGTGRVIAVSAGNHGLAVAHGAEQLGIEATIVVPKTAVRTKVEAIRRYPVELLEIGQSYDEAERAARRLAEERRLPFVSPYNDADVIAGQATIALELLEEQPELEVIVAPAGGGGLLAGLAIAAKAIRPSVRVIGAGAAASCAIKAGLEAGWIVEIADRPTIADGLAGNLEPDAITFEPIQRLVERVIAVGEDAIAKAIVAAAEHAHLMIEGSAAVALAALTDPEFPSTKARTAVVITGRNIDYSRFLALTRAHGADPRPV